MKHRENDHHEGTVCIYLFFCYVHDCFAFTDVCAHGSDWWLQRSEEGVGSPGTGVIEDCELACGCWELNPSSLQVRHVFLTMEPSLQPREGTF